MKTTIHKKDLTKKDGFPEDVDRNETVIVQIVDNPNNRYNICCYTDKSGIITNWFLPNELSLKYQKGIYVLNR